jgi:hypothetical protein
MYLAEYEAPQLGGLGKKLKRLVKKVIKPVAHIGAAILTGGATLSISAQMMAQHRAKKAAAAQAAADAKAQAEFDKSMKAIMAPPAGVAPAAAPLAPIISIAPTAAAVSQAQLPVSYTPPPSARVRQTRPDSWEKPAAPLAVSPLPPWVIPAGIGGAVLLAVMTMGRGRGR